MSERGRGQPTKYTVELADKICRLISTHPNGLPTLIKMYNLPDRQTIYNWLNKYDNFFDNYMRAKEQQAHILADDMLELADDIPTYEDRDGVERIDNGMISRSKIHMDAIKWSAARLAPRWYGDIKHEHTNTNAMLEKQQKQYAELDELNKKEF